MKTRVEGLHPVRQVQEHLRRAGALVAQGRHDAARGEVDAALAIDPGSLVALTLRKQIDGVESRAGAARPPAAGRHASRPRTPVEHFIPPGVGAHSWIGFEHRVQQRRFQSLLDAAATALAARDAAAARAALDEARELCPDAPQLLALSAAAAALPPGATPAFGSHPVSRAVGAVAMLLAGVGLLLGIDAMRRSDEAPVVLPTAAPVARSDRDAVEAGMVADAATKGGARTAVTQGREPDVAIRRVAAPARLNSRAAPQPAEGERVRQSAGETSDDYVAPGPRSTAAVSRTDLVPPDHTAPEPGAVPAARASLGGLTLPATPNASPAAASPAAAAATAAGPLRPVPAVPAGPARVVSGSRPARPATEAAAAPAPIVPPPADERGVALALDQYARAYTQLDARAARAVWPTVNERALARAFAGLESQDVSFDACDIEVRGTMANAACRGRASFVGKVGRREPRTEVRQWVFELRRDGEAWKIERIRQRANE